MPLRLLTTLFLINLLISCSPYRNFRSNYTFRSESGIPDYLNLDYWAAHPYKWDPSDSIPKPLLQENRDSTVDVFFIHPTTLTYKTGRKAANAVIDDRLINSKTDYTTILYQASVFNKDCRVFSPRYRQAHIRNFFEKDTTVSERAFRIAYADIKTAFLHYLDNYNHGKPIIIAAHSQGSRMALLLLKEFFENGPLRQKLVVAYVTGWPVKETDTKTIRMCRDSMETSCICSWRTFRRGYIPSYFKKENGSTYATNPLTWVTSGEHVSRSYNKGSVLTKFNKLYKHTTDAQASNGLLFVKKPRFPWSFLYFTRNYHIGDINLFYMNIRENVGQRIGAFWKQ
jgi:hypothetical protein